MVGKITTILNLLKRESKTSEYIALICSGNKTLSTQLQILKSTLPGFTKIHHYIVAKKVPPSTSGKRKKGDDDHQSEAS